ncbi:MAG: SRPBCC domain-containing protein [Chloroflexi bacterium]|nr:SRPBCC domain-containing protein [Chloroflexota bacterium]MDA1145193.1 SRPBCC domain-containing protein [Chloroflexota bacterium]
MSEGGESGPIDPSRINDRELIVTRVLPATPEVTFSFWTDPAHISDWWGPEGFTTTTQSMDLRTDGEWLFTMHGPDGQDYDNRVEFSEVSRPSRLTYRHRGRDAHEPISFHATVTFAPLGEQTLLTMRMVFDTPEALARVEEANGASVGQHQTLARFAERLAAHVQAERAGPAR